MKNREIQKISNRFTRNILTIQGIVFICLIGLMVSSTYLLKRELADQMARSIEGKIKKENTRETINILSDARSNDFIAIDLYDKNLELQYTFPTRFRRDVPGLKRLWRQLTQASYKKEIFFDLKEKNVLATLVFTFGIFQLFPMAVIIFIIGLLATYPLVRRYKALLMDNLEKETIKGQTEALSELARQVRHDYKSPLMAIKSVIDRAKLKDFEKKTLSIAYNRMISMLGDLSQENIKKVLKNKQKMGKGKALTHVYSSVLSVVEEKKARHPELHTAFFTHKGDLNKEKRTPQNGPHIVVRILCSDDDKRAYILIDDVELQRVVSNLLENSIESIQNFKPSGEILIHINVDGPILKIEIGDNGKGIPKEVFHKVGKKGYSFGKRNGEGLGLYSAIRKIKAWNGSLKIDSTENLGTQIKIELPGAKRPDWASSQINLEGIEKVVILDDDKSIHQIWTEKLKAKIPVIHKFTSAKKLMKKVDQFGRKTLFLLDYELRGQRETGLDIARDLGQDNPCYLVTNSFQDPLIQRECKRLGAGLLPKTII